MPKAPSAPSVFHLLPPVDAVALANVRSRAAMAARAGLGPCVIDIDAIPKLDTAVISTLIATLREVRDAGTDLILAVERKALLETLSVTGLDKVFTLQMPSDAPLGAPELDEAPPPKPRRRRRTRLAAASVLTAGLIFGLAGSSGAQDLPSASGVIEQVVAANPSLHSYQARVHVAVHMQSFPFLAPRLEGTTYFKRPDNYEVVFDRVPGYAKGFERLYADIGDPTTWPSRFKMTVIGEKTVDAHPDVVVRLVQRVRGMIDHQDVAVDEATWRIDEMEWHYYNGGVITMTQNFEHAGAWSVLASQHAVIRIPYVHAVADARYDDYHTNVAIDDTVFTKKSK